jgi:hypothetical protein
MRHLALALAILLGLARPSAGAELTVIAATGQKIPGSAKKLKGVEAPYVGPNGEAAFIGWVGKVRTLLLWKDGTLRVVARDGGHAAGFPTAVRHNGVTLLGFDDAGQVYYSSDSWVASQRRFYFGVWRYDPVRKKRTLLVGAPKNYTALGKLEFLSAPSVGGGGHVAFLDHLGRLLLLAPDGTFSVLAAPGDAAPGAGGSAFVSFNGPFRVGATGEVGFNALVEETPGSEERVGGVWKRASGGAVALVAMPGSPAPGAAPGSAFELVAAKDGDAAGALSLDARLEPGTGDVVSGNEQCVLGPVASVETIVAREDAFAPGLAGARFASFTGPPLADAAGRVLVRAELQIGEGGVVAEDAEGLWRSDGAGALDLVLQVGHELPGLSESLLAIYHAVPGRDGTLALAGPVGPAGSTDLSQRALVGIRAGGPAEILIRDGDTLELSPGVTSEPGYYLLANTAPDRPDVRTVGAGTVGFYGYVGAGKTAAVLATLDEVPAP